MQLSQSLLFDKYTYSFSIYRPSIRILELLFIMCNQVAVRLDLAQSSLYDSTTIVIGIVYPQRAITSERLVPAFSRFRPVDMQLIQCLRLDTVLNRDKTDCQRRRFLVAGVAGYGDLQRQDSLRITKDSTWNNLVDSSARSSLLASQKKGQLVKLGDLSNLHRRLNEITTKSKRKSFKNNFLILFCHFNLSDLDVSSGQIYHNFYNKFVFASYIC